MAKKRKENKKTSRYGALVLAIILLMLIIFCVSKFGVFGMIANNLFSYLIGPYYLLTLLSLFAIFIMITIFDNKAKLNVWFYIGIIVLNVAVYLLGAHQIYSSYDYGMTQIVEVSEQIRNITTLEGQYGGGLIGMLLLLLSYVLFAKEGTEILIIFLFLIAAILIIPLGVVKSILQYMKETSIKAINNIKNKKDVKKQPEMIENKLRRKKRKTKNDKPIIKDPWILDDDQIKTIETKKEKEQIKVPALTSDTKPKTTYTNNGTYRLPPLSLLDSSNNKASSLNKHSAQIKGQRLIEVLENFDVHAELVNTYIGPSITKFEVKPDYSINLNKITSLQNNLKMELAAKSIRIEAPVPGKSVVGVEIPNAESSMVSISDLMKNVPSSKADNKLLFTLGKDVMGQPVYCELNKMPHLLIAGATGSGKSVCVNTIICSLLMRTNPEDVRLVLIDPKMVEFAPYHDIPHLLWPVVTDSTKAKDILERLNVIMDDRYNDFMEASVRNIETYNSYVENYNTALKEDEKPKEKMPYIVVIIDELAELMAVAKNDVQLSIQRFTAKARACGMHLITATQRPSTDVVTGLIKSNIPSRIAFAVASQIDSRTILGTKGAEDLLGNGDMLYVPQGQDPKRIQGAFVSDKEINNITSFVKKQAKPEYDDFYFQLENINNNAGAFSFNGEGGNQKDALYDEVIEFIKTSQKASASVLQRRFGIGYNRASRIMDQLEEQGLVGPSNGSKSREIYIKPDDE